MISNYDLWLRACEEFKRELHLLEYYEDKKHVVKLFKVVEKYEYKHNFYNKVIYCLWDNDKMQAILEYPLAYSTYVRATNKYIQKMMIKGKGQYIERSVVK